MAKDKPNEFFSSVPYNGQQNAPLDNLLNVISFSNVSTPPLQTAAQFVYGGAFSGTADTIRQRWSKARTPTIFKTVATAALGSTVIWTPGASNKFRLLGYCIQLSANASIAVAGILSLSFLDAAAGIGLTHDYFVPAAALAGNNYPPITIDLGQFGILSALANNALNVSLSVALATGSFRVLAMGTEE